MFNLVFYLTPTGKCPAAEFIDSLQQNLQAKAVRDLDIFDGTRLSIARTVFKASQGRTV